MIRDDLITITWLRERDVTGVLASYEDATTAEAIKVVSFDMCNRVGHDWGDSTSIEILEGVKSPNMFLAGKTKYPLRTLKSIVIDDSTVLITDYLRQYINVHIGNLIDRLKFYYGTWEGLEVVINGVWGWADTPEDVKEAIFRLVVLELTGKPYGRRRSSTAEVYGDQILKSLKLSDGLAVEFQGPTTSSTVSTAETTGDDFCDLIIDRYRWESCGGVV